MKFDELKDKTVAELATQSRELRQELFNLRLQKATAQLEKPSRLRILRKDIARVETRITQLRLQSAQPKAA
ncbi:MAG: 50S ribosomal protein L29 [Verrucomicrobia bacterium]|nr:50S ribosomal protein L29 [Verrucomicrobiota bacterium]